MIDHGSGFGADESFRDTAAEASGPAVGVVRVGKRDYAVGLHWSSIQTSRPADEARAMAADEAFRADLFCLRQGATPQFGLGFKGMRQKPRMPSLAAHLASSKAGSWIGLFAVNGGWYLVAVRDDGILSECDRFIASEEAARNLLDDYVAQSSWGEIVAPKAMGVPGSSESLIEDVLEGKPPVLLQDVRQTSSVVKFCAAALLVGAAVVGFMYYQKTVEEAELARIAQEQIDKVSTAVGITEPQIVVPPMPWEGQARAAEYVRTCVDGIGALRTDMPGWRLKSAECLGRAVVATLERRKPLGAGGGPVTELRVSMPGASVSYPPEGSGTTVLAAVDMPEVPTIPIDTATLPKAQLSRSIVEVMESRLVPVSLTSSDENEFWRGVAFSFKTGLDPKGFTDLLAALPAAIITKVSLDAATAEWTLEGKVYEQLPLPENAAQPAR